jgi:CDP-diacylglycerol---glycerol-3-phosphate 3-phosphatidyltransferase
MGAGIFSGPQLLSLSRILAAVPIAALILTGTSATYFAAAALFAAVSLTDLLDGPLARRGRSVGTLGIYLDTTADKVLVSVVLIALVSQHLVDAWMAMVIVGREFLVSGVRTLAGAQGFVISANFAGKIKTTVTMVAITLVLLWANAGTGGFISRFDHLAWMQRVTWVGMLLATILTLYSGIKYIVDGRPLFTVARRGGPTAVGINQEQPAGNPGVDGRP